jgi:hypothetical protein
MGDQRQVAVMTPEAAKARALAILAAHETAISYVRHEDLDTQGMFVPVVAPVEMKPADMHNLGGGQKMPKKHLVDRMAEAAGVEITAVDVRNPSPHVWIGKAHGRKRMPDGSMRPGEGEYSFDADVYAELDFLRDTEGKYATEKAQKIHTLDYVKVGHRRASTGARLALIRYFCKCPTSWKDNELPPEIMLCRVDLNTDALLASPEMRDAAIAHAVGATRDLFGPAQGGERNVTPAPAAIEAPAEEPELDFGDDPAASELPAGLEIQPPTEPTPEEHAIAEARAKLQEWQHSNAVKAHRARPGKKSAAQAIREALADKDAPLAELERILGLCLQVQASYERAQARKGGTA